MPTKPVWIILIAFLLISAGFATGAGAAGPPTDIYRSVGPSNLAPLASGAPINGMSIVLGLAGFVAPLPTNVGVGDVIVYDSDANGSQDALAFIHGRTGPNAFIVRTVTGAMPADMPLPDLDWQIYRAYESLYQAERGEENPGIPGSLPNFDTWSNGKNIVSSNERWNIACYGDAADTQYVNIDGWNTAANNYIRVFTPWDTSEVGTSQRHNGTWSTSAYRLEVTDTDGIDIREYYVRLEGLQIRFASLNTDTASLIWLNTNSYCEVFISHTILRGVTSSSAVANNGVYIEGTGGWGHISFWNNLIYDFDWHNTVVGFNGPDHWYRVFAYNNTVVDCRTGFAASGTSITAKNNITQGCNDGYAGAWFQVFSRNNVSDIPADPPGSNPIVGAVSFVNASSNNFHLSASDTTARNAGANLSSDPIQPFSDDIDNQTRSGTWDVGADEAMGAPSTPTFTPIITLSRTPTFTVTPTLTETTVPTPSLTPTVTPSHTSGQSPTFTPTGTITPSQTITVTFSATPTNTPTSSVTFTRTGTPTFTASPTITLTPTISPTLAVSVTYSATGTPSFTVTPTPTVSATATISATATATSSITPSPSVTPTLTISATHTISPTSVPLVVDDIKAYPQPATGSTVYFYYKLDEPAQIEIEIYNVTGERVATLRENKPGRGYERTQWDIRDAAPGVYLYRLKTRTNSGTSVSGIKKMVIVVIRR